MNSYCARWEMLQKGVSVEHQVRGLFLRVGFRLSSELGIRCNPYIPALDIDNADMRIHLVAADGTWAINIEVSVRSSSRRIILLGRENQYGSTSRWLKQSKKRKTPCLLFQYDWSSKNLYVFRPQELRAIAAIRSKLSIPIPPQTQDVEETLFNILKSVASSPSEQAAREQLS